MENAIDEVVRRLGQLALVRAVAPGPLEQGDEPVPRHQPHDPFGGHDDPGVSQFEPHPPVAVAAQAVLEHVAHQGEQPLVPVRPLHRVQLMVVGAARQTDPGEQTLHGDAMSGTDGLDEDCLLPIGRVVRVCAPLFSHQIQRPLEDRQLDLRLPFLPAQPLDLRAYTITLRDQPLQVRHVMIRTGRAIVLFPQIIRSHWIALRYRFSQQLTLPGFSRPTPPRPPRPRPAATSHRPRPAAPPPYA